MISAKARLLTLLFVCSGPVGFEASQGPGLAVDRAAQIVRNNNLGVAYMEQLKFDEAAAEFARNTEVEGSFVPGWVNLGIAHFYRQDYDSALAAFKRALDLDPNQIRARFMTGLIYRNQDFPEDSIREFLEVTRQDPDDPTSNYFLGLLYSRQKDYPKAIGMLRKSIEKQPYNASAIYNLAIALIRSGEREAGQEEMARFRTLQGRFGTDTVGLQYREQGRYSFVIDNLSEYLPEGEVPARRNPVTFVEIASQSRVTSRNSRPVHLASEVASLSEFESNIVAYVGSGVTFGDYDGDGHDDLLVADASPKGSTGTLYRNRGDGTFEDRTPESKLHLTGKTMVGLWGDVDNDEDLDLYLVNFGKNVLYRNDGDGRFTDTTESAGVGNASWGVSGAFVDADHDGDLDILVANFVDPPRDLAGPLRFPDAFPGTVRVLYRNNGNGTFTDIALEAGLNDRPVQSLAVMTGDFNDSRDIDFYLAGFSSANQLFSNRRDGTFSDVASSAGTGQIDAVGLAVADVNQDGLMDLVLGGRDSRQTRLLLNQPNHTFQAVDLGGILGSMSPPTIQNVEALDYDNDGDLDLLFAGSSFLDPNHPGQRNNFALLENQRGEFRNVTTAIGLDRFKDLAVRGLSVTDYDNDGDLDFAVNVNGGAPMLFRNDGGNRNNWLQVRLVSSSSNKQGIGTKVEVLTGRHWQKMEVASGQGFLSQSPPMVHFGLGDFNHVDVVRMLWPGGVLQSEMDRAINTRLSITELDRKGTSCPIMYVWSGDRYSFHTDFLGGSAFGSLIKPGMYNYPDTDEYVRLERENLRLKDGHVAITLNNQLEEVIFFDHAELVSVDHPAEYEVYPDEKLLPGPPYQDFRLFSVSRGRAPVAATDGSGRDILSPISRIDRIYPHLFEPLPWKGYANLHEMILDLGDVDPQRVVLIMHAWIDYADSTSNLAASQAGIDLAPPLVQVQDEEGRWVTVIDRMGFPAGLPKPMTVDLSGKFLSKSRKVKIVTNMRIYWDRVWVETGPGRRDYRLHRQSASYADLHFRGFPEWVSPDGRLPRVYDYDRIVTEPQWKTQTGAYTRYGDVLPLLNGVDDHYVITRSGDEIEVLFDVSSLPVLPQGWVRDYLVYVNGFGKDMDLNSAMPDHVGPLPFHDMTCYPYPEGEGPPQTQEDQEFLRKWNTRMVEEWYPALRKHRLPEDGSGLPTPE